MQYLLELEEITKSFPGVKALDGVSLRVRPGTVHSLMGENGAGKSTLMKCLFGINDIDGGTVRLEGREVRFRSPKQALENGVAMVHQELNQVHTRSVMENIWLGRFPKTKLGTVDHGAMRRATRKIFDDLGLDIDPGAIISTLPISQRQMAEIARAVSYNSKVIVFDEPTSSLTDSEVERLFAIINRLRDEGCGVIYISHKMSEILQISDDITVMRDGKWVNTSPASEMTMDEIIHLMVGREITNVYPPKTNQPREEILRVEKLSALHVGLKEASFTARKGEIVGLAGLAGAGRTELLETLFGAATRRGGTITLHDRVCRNRSCRESMRNGFALVTEERRSSGIFGVLDITANTTVSKGSSYLWHGLFLQPGLMKKDTDWAIKALNIKTASQRTRISTLSGGNQQKVIFGRWLLTRPEVLLLDEPTRGIDVGAKYEIYQLIIDLANEGKTIIMASSEMPELLGVCDRIIVMSGGRIAGELPPDSSQEEIMALAAKYV